MPTINQLPSIDEVSGGNQIPTYYSGGGDARKMSVSLLQDYLQDNLNLPDNASEITYNPAGTSAVARTVESKLRDVVSVKDFGAVGDGVTDDILAFTRAIATGKDVLVPEGTYRLAPTAVQTIANLGEQLLYGEGTATLKVDLASSIQLFIFNGPVSLENLSVDFNQKSCSDAFTWASNVGHINIKNVKVFNLKDTNSAISSTTFVISAAGNTFDIENIKATSMLKRGNGSESDSGGAYNMIFVWGQTSNVSTKGSIRNVFASEIHNINASDQIIYEDTAVIYISTPGDDKENNVVIDGVHGYNFGKRIVKTQASNVSISNVVGNVTAEDTLCVISLQQDAATYGVKTGCSATNIVGYGKMNSVIECSALGSKINNVVGQTSISSAFPTDANTLLLRGDNIVVDGVWSNSQRDIGIGFGLQIIKNLTLKNINLVIGTNKAGATTIYSRSDTLGFDGVLIDGLNAIVNSDVTAPSAAVWMSDYFNGTTKVGRNLTIKNVIVKSSAVNTGYAIDCKYIENMIVDNVRYINTSGASHFRIVQAVSCINVNVSDVIVEGSNVVGVNISGCTGKNVVSRVYNPGATQNSVYNYNSTDVTVMNCDTAQVSGALTPTWQNSKMTVGTTANRPTVGLTPYFTQYFDTTITKPIWWDGSVWKDATGTTV
jgi:Pectate lyase superfamily protein